MHSHRKSDVLRTARDLRSRLAARLPAPDFLSRLFRSAPEGGDMADPRPLPPTGSALDATGPVPAELLAAPAPEDSVPWSIRLAETERDWTRKINIWRVAAVVSWAVTAVAVLKGLGAI